MRILSKYVLREFLVPVVLCLAGFSAIYLVVEMFGEMDKILQARPPPATLLIYLGGYLAAIMQWLMPAALMLGALYAMWQLARHSEITAMRATGIGFSAITAPMLAASFVCAILLALNSEFFAPWASHLAHQIKENRFEPVEDAGIQLDVPYNNFADKRAWRITRLDLDKGTTGPLRITWTDADGQPIRVLDAKEAAHLDGVWWFTEPEITEHERFEGVSMAASVRRPLALLAMPELTETPRDFFLELMQGDDVRENLSLRDMLRYVRTRPQLPPNIRVSWRYDIYSRMVAPWACVVITLFAIPAGVATGRQSVFLGVVAAVALFFSFYAMTLICGGMAKRGVIPPEVGVLLPGTIYLVIGLVLFHRQR